MSDLKYVVFIEKKGNYDFSSHNEQIKYSKYKVQELTSTTTT